MITVLEVITLKTEHANLQGALLAGQAYDELLHHNAHRADGYIDHAAFMFQEPDRLVILYPWRDEPSVQELLVEEEQILAPFFNEFCVGGRQVSFLTELPVEV